MADPRLEDHSQLFKEIGGFSQRKLKKVETKVVTGLGDNVIEKRGAKGLQKTSVNGAAPDAPTKKLDLQVGLIVPGLMIGSQDVAGHKKTIEEYGITHILNLAADVIENQFEDEYNYLSLCVPDRESTSLCDFYEEAFDFMDEGRHQGNCLVHCDATKPGLSRSTAICIAYLMRKEERRYEQAFADVKEARSFVRPSDSFARQLKQLEQQLFAESKKDDIEDAFTKKKRQEIEAEKAALAVGVKLKDRAKLFASPDPNESASPAVQTPGSGNLKNKWNPTPAAGEVDPLAASRLAYEGRRQSSTDSSGSKKLTSIIGMFSKPREEAPSGGGTGVFPISKNTAPAKKWKTVEPPPRPGTVQLKRNKSRKFYTDTVRRNKSKGNLKQASIELNNNNSSMNNNNNNNNNNYSSSNNSMSSNATSEKKQPPPPPQLLCSTTRSQPEPVPSTLKRQSSIPQSNGVTPTPATPASRSVPSATPAPPPPPPPPPAPPLAPPTLQTQPPTPSYQNKTATPVAGAPWRKSSNDSLSSAVSHSPSVSPCPSDSSRSSIPSGRASQGSGPMTRKPSIELTSTETPQYRSTISMSPARRGSKSPDDRVEQTPTPPANRMVFGKVKPPPLKIVGSSLSTERSVTAAAAPPPPPPPPPVRTSIPPPVQMTDQLVQEITKPTARPAERAANSRPNSTTTTACAKAGGKKNSDRVYESDSSDSEESEEDELDGDGYTQIYDHRRPSEQKGLNRSSTMEILNLIKSKTGSNLAAHANLGDIDEDDEIENLLQGLETEGIDNVDWGELGIDLGEVKDIVGKHEDDEDTEEYECETEESEEITAEEEEDSEPEVRVAIKVQRPGLRS